MHLATLQQLLEHRTGLSFETLGERLIERAVTRRMAACDVADARGYIACVQRSEDEFQHLVDEISVPETWFFRDQKPFAYLAEYARRSVGVLSGGRLNILSAACSTGEEPYSIAMSLLDAGLNADQFHIDAVDISTRALAAARQGVYTRNSFRGTDLRFQARYFVANGDHYLLTDHVKATVRFLHGNVMDLGRLRGYSPYHIVFCRNVLIYFGLDNKAKVLGQLHELLAEEGVLFVGHADTGRLADARFVSVGEPNTFAYRKSAAAELPERKVLRAPLAPARRRSATASAPVVPVEAHEAKPPSRAQEAVCSFEDIQQRADRGELEHAARLCLDYLDVHPASVAAHCLLGTIRLAQSERDKAQDCFRKAVYLDPGHYESLTHLATLAEQAGDDQAAGIYRERADRAIATSSVHHFQ